MASIYIGDAGGESLEYLKTVERCWQIQHERYGKDLLNGTFPDEDIKDLMRIPDNVVLYASEMAEKEFFSARGFTRALRVARTIADIKEAKDVSVDDIAEASQYRVKGAWT